MRYEILKFLSTGYDYKDLGSFIKKKYPNVDLKEVLILLKEMYTGPQYRESNIIEIDGREWELLGKDFFEVDTYGKVEALRKEGLGIKENGIISRGVGNLENCKISARITDLGRKELDKRESNVFLGIKVSTLTVILSILSLIISIIALIRGNR